MQMTMDVFNNHNRIIHQQAQRKNQRKQRNPVNRLPREQTDGQHNKQNQRNIQGHDGRFAPAEENQQDDNHRHNRDAQMLDEQIHRIIGARARITGNGHIHIIGNQLAPEAVQLLLYVPGNKHGVGTAFFGQRNRNRRHLDIRAVQMNLLATGGAEADAVIGRHLGRAVVNLGNIAQIHRLALPLPHDQTPDLIRILQISVQPDPSHKASANKIAFRTAGIGRGQRAVQLIEGYVIGGQSRRIQCNGYFMVATAENIGH